MLGLAVARPAGIEFGLAQSSQEILATAAEHGYGDQGFATLIEAPEAA